MIDNWAADTPWEAKTLLVVHVDRKAQYVQFSIGLVYFRYLGGSSNGYAKVDVHVDINAVASVEAHIAGVLREPLQLSEAAIEDLAERALDILTQPEQGEENEIQKT